LTPPGVDAEGFAAHAHLCSPRADGPLVTVDATEREARSLEVWRDEARSPLVAAHGGTLLILGASALPSEIQEHLAQFLGSRAQAESVSQVLPAGLVFSFPSPAQALLEAGRLHEGLARLLGERQLQLPRLADRAEDLRALVLEGLSRFGVGTSGEPLGIEPAALATLTEHEFPGNELELFGLIARTAATARGPRLTLPDLLGSGLGSVNHHLEAPSELSDDPGLNPPPSLAVRRRSLRRAPGR
jgi:DNA-binding NtrC family response regulator